MEDLKQLTEIVNRFAVEGTVESVAPLGNGLINSTYIVRTAEASAPDYVLQRINHNVFTDVATLQTNIEAVTAHIRHKLIAAGESDIDRKVLRFIEVKPGAEPECVYATTGLRVDGSYWRVMRFIDGAHTLEAVTPESSRFAGEAFGNFQSMLVDIDAELRESIPDFHNMEFRLRQLREAVAADSAGRVAEVRDLLDEIESRAPRGKAAQAHLPLRHESQQYAFRCRRTCALRDRPRHGDAKLRV
jgi:hypothetical protein